MLVSAWYTYNIDGTGELAFSASFQTPTHTDAMNILERTAQRLNKKFMADNKKEITLITCNGYIRCV